MLLLQTCFKSCFLVFSEDQLMRVVHKFQTCHVIHTAAVVTCCRWFYNTKCVDAEKILQTLLLFFLTLFRFCTGHIIPHHRQI